mmetsp:Transcript_116476/g.370483  ORF Transcript_116476/g.370483 Transcript_116476/m.370483 type:complete len:348 (-) Transcript_116476:101-1144(-)
MHRNLEANKHVTCHDIVAELHVRIYPATLAAASHKDKHGKPDSGIITVALYAWVACGIEPTSPTASLTAQPTNLIVQTRARNLRTVPSRRAFGQSSCEGAAGGERFAEDFVATSDNLESILCFTYSFLAIEVGNCTASGAKLSGFSAIWSARLFKIFLYLSRLSLQGHNRIFPVLSWCGKWQNLHCTPERQAVSLRTKMQGLQVPCACRTEPMDIGRPSSSWGIPRWSGSGVLPIALLPLLVEPRPGVEPDPEDATLCSAAWPCASPRQTSCNCRNSALSSSVRLLLQLEDRELVGSEVARRTARNPATVTARGSDTCKNVFLLCKCESVQGSNSRPASSAEVSELL